jgi:hypothetical protein
VTYRELLPSSNHIIPKCRCKHSDSALDAVVVYRIRYVRRVRTTIMSWQSTLIRQRSLREGSNRYDALGNRQISDSLTTDSLLMSHEPAGIFAPASLGVVQTFPSCFILSAMDCLAASSCQVFIIPDSTAFNWLMHLPDFIIQKF